jgi:hypothetical protein
MDADIDKNILFENLTLPFKSVFYILPKNSLLIWFSLNYVSERDDYLLYGVTGDNQITSIFLRDALTSPDVNDNEIQKYNPIILFAIATLLFHKTSGFGQKSIPITPIPLMKNQMGKIVFREGKRISPNILHSPKISYRKTNENEQGNEPQEFEGYRQNPSHIRIIKDKKTGYIKIIAVSSSEVNPDKRREGVQFQKNKMTDQEMSLLINARKDDIVSRMNKRGFSEEEIEKVLKQKDLKESFFRRKMSFKEYFYIRESIMK